MFAICSTMAALGGIILASRLNSVDTSTGGGTILLYSIAAAVIGGTSLFGGRGRGQQRAAGRDRDRDDRQRPRPARTSAPGRSTSSPASCCWRPSRSTRSHGGGAPPPAGCDRALEMDPVRWGVLSTAHINEKVLAGASGSQTVEVTAVASRSLERAAEFARAHGHPARARELRGAAGRRRGRGDLHPAAERAARGVDARRAGGGQARAVREAAGGAVGRCGALLRRRGGGRPRAVGGVHVAPPPAGGPSRRARATRERSASCGSSARRSRSCSRGSRTCAGTPSSTAGR